MKNIAMGSLLVKMAKHPEILPIYISLNGYFISDSAESIKLALSSFFEEEITSLKIYSAYYLNEDYISPEIKILSPIAEIEGVSWFQVALDLEGPEYAGHKYHINIIHLGENYV